MRLERAAAINLLLLIGCLVGCGKEQQGARPNAILISIDTLRYDHLGFHGYARPTSPVMDALARGGVVFEQAIAQAPWTTPSHAAMLMSEYPSALRLGSWKNPGVIHPNAVSVAEVLRDAGYRTHAVVAGGFVRGKIGFDQGFEEYDETGYDMTMTVDNGMEWLDGVHADAPFFLFLHTYDVHKYSPPAPYRSRFDQGYAGPLKDRQYLARFVQNENSTPEQAARITPEDLRYIVDMYDGAINYVDHEIGRLLDYLDRRELRTNTLIVLTSDHGEEFLEHGITGHGYSLYDENLRVPLVLSHPSLSARRVREQVRLLDVAPTIVDLLGLRPQPSWQGLSLRLFIAGGRTNLPAFSEHAHFPMKSMRTVETKLIVMPREPFRQLFDLKRDPRETESVFDRDPENGAMLANVLQNQVRANLACDRFEGAGRLELDEDLRRQLEELGYVGGEPAVDAPDGWVEAALRGRPPAPR